MTLEIRDEELQYNFNKEAAKILALSSGKIGKYEFLQVKTDDFLIEVE